MVTFVITPLIILSTFPVGETKPPCLCFDEIARNLTSPIALQQSRDGRFFVTSQIGEVNVYFQNGSRVTPTFLDIKDQVTSSSEARGLLGMALHPNFERNGRFFIFFNRDDIMTLSEVKVDASNPNRANKSSQRVMLQIATNGSQFGGPIITDENNYLYLFVGDGGPDDSPGNYAQNKTSLRGKVLKLDVSQELNQYPYYSIPKYNPFTCDPEFSKEVYAYGVRNPLGAAIDIGDRLTGAGRGRIIFGDVGVDSWEEVNLLKRGKNYGWPIKEGLECYKQESHTQTNNAVWPLECKVPNEELPIHVYSHDQGSAIFGGAVYRGCINPLLNGYYISGDLIFGLRYLKEIRLGSNIWVGEMISPCRQCPTGLSNSFARFIVGVHQDLQGEVYILSTGGSMPSDGGGFIHRIVDPRSYYPKHRNRSDNRRGLF